MASPGEGADGNADSSGVTEQRPLLELQARLAQAEAQLAFASDEQAALRSAFEQAAFERNALGARYAALKEALGTGDALTVAVADTTPGRGEVASAVPLTLVLLAEHSAVADAALAALRQRLLRDGGLPPDIQGASRAAVEAHGAVRAVVSTLDAIHGDSAELARFRHARRHTGALPSSNDGRILERCRQLEAQQEAHARQLTEAHAARDAALEQLSGARAHIDAFQRVGRELQAVQLGLETDLSRCRDALAAQAAELVAFKHEADAKEQEQCALVASLQARVEATAGVATSELDVLRQAVLKLRSQRDEARAAAAALTADAREARAALEQEREATAAASVELAAAHARVDQLEAEKEDAALEAVTMLEQLRGQLQDAEAGHVDAHAALELQLAETHAALRTALAAEEASAGARAVLVEKCSVYRSMLFAAQVERGDDASVAGDALAQAGAVIDALHGRLDRAEQGMSAELQALEQRLASAQQAAASALQRAADAEEQVARLRPALAEVATLQAALSSVEGSLDAQRRELDHCRSELRARDARIRDLLAEDRMRPPSAQPSPPPPLWPPDTEALEHESRVAAEADKQAAVAAAVAEADTRAASQLAAQREAASAEAKRLQRLLTAAKAQAQRLESERAAVREAAQAADAGAAECSTLRARLQASDAHNARLRRMAAELQQRLSAVQATTTDDRDAGAAALRKSKADAAQAAASVRRCEGLLRDALAQRDNALRECASAQASLRDSADAAARATRAAASAAARRHGDALVALLASLRAVAHKLVSVVGTVAGQASDTVSDARALITELCDGVEASLQREPFRGDLLDRLLALCAGFAEEAAKPRKLSAQ